MAHLCPACGFWQRTATQKKSLCDQDLFKEMRIPPNRKLKGEAVVEKDTGDIVPS